MGRILIMMAAALTAAAVGAVDAKSRRSDPSDAASATVPLRFETGLEPARSEPDADPAGRWKEHNDRVRAIGGHVGYVRAAEGGRDAKAAAGDPAGKR